MNEFYKKLDHTRLSLFTNHKSTTVHPNDTNFLMPGLTSPLTPQQVEAAVTYCLSKLKIPVDEYNENFELVRTGTPGNWNDFRYLRQESSENVCASISYGDKIIAVAIFSSGFSNNMFRKSKSEPVNLIKEVENKTNNSINTFDSNQLISTCDSFEFISTVDSNNIRSTTKSLVPKIKFTTINHEDIFSMLWNVLNDNEVKEIIYDNPKILRYISNYSSIYSHHTNLINLIYKENRNVNINKAVSMLISYLNLKNPEVEMFSNNSALTYGIDFYESFVPDTPQGKRLLKNFMHYPLIEIDEIKKRQIYSEIIGCCSIPCNKYSDLRRIVDSIENKKISLESIFRITQIVDSIEELHGFLVRNVNLYTKSNEFLDRNILKLGNSNMSMDSNDLNNISLGLESSVDCEKSIENTSNFIDCYKKEILQPLKDVLESLKPMTDEIKKVVTVENRINENLNPNLKTLKAELINLEDEINKELNRVILLNKKIRRDGDNFRIGKTEYKEEIFKKNKFVVISILRSGVVFTTFNLSKTVERKKEVLNLVEENEKEIKRRLIEFLKQFTCLMDILNYFVGFVDVLNSFYKKRIEGWCLPIFGNNYEIVKMFHPGVENPIKNDFKGFVGKNVDGAKIDCKENFENPSKNVNNQNMSKNTIITGPNMGGKSTFLKTICLISIYGQIGAPVPADKCKIPLFHSIFMRGGAKDCASRFISTFQSEMNDIAFMCRHATEKSLILIDELGRGTSAIDGLSISYAVKNFFVKINCFCFTATHFTQLCCEKSSNYFVEMEDGLINFLMKKGVAKGSFGIEVAERAGVIESVIENAKRYLNE